MKIVKSGPFRVRLSTEKKLPSVLVGLFSLREKAPTKNKRIDSAKKSKFRTKNLSLEFLN